MSSPSTPSPLPTTSRRTQSGVVLRRSGTNTVCVEVERVMRHPLYNKRVTFHKRYLVHDPGSKAEVGTTVTIEEDRPRSRSKHWSIVSSK